MEKKLIFGITLRELLWVFLFYFTFSWLYHIVLWYSIGTFKDQGIWGWVDLKEYWFNAGLSYLFYFLVSIFIWFVSIRSLQKKSMFFQIIAVFVLIPLATYFTRELRYVIIDNTVLGRGRLKGPAEVWDWYIPVLFLTVQFGFLFAYRYFKENQRKLLIEGELRQAALKSELAAIKAQLNPHFLYNVFNTINASVPPKNERTRNMIAQLSDLFRYQLRASKTDLVTLEEELDFLKKYLDLEKERFKDRLRIDINVPKDLMNEKIPLMLLQPLVENSIKHGLSSLV